MFNRGSWSCCVQQGVVVVLWLWCCVQERVVVVLCSRMGGRCAVFNKEVVVVLCSTGGRGSVVFNKGWLWW